ncbi:hypothetical protein P885DRAFT_68433 [Corynascus similis CBS 632.67]
MLTNNYASQEVDCSQDLDTFSARQLELYEAEFSGASWAVQPPIGASSLDPWAFSESIDPFTSLLADDMLSGVNLAFEPENINSCPSYTPPQSSASGSPTTPVYDIPYSFSFYELSRVPAPLTPNSLLSATPDSASPTITDNPIPQHYVPAALERLACPELGCDAVFATKADLRKHATRKHRPPRFHCPFAASASKGAAGRRRCASGFPDSRALHRHLWTHHTEYAQEQDVPSERAQCPLCSYTGRGDNVARHMKRHGRR